MREVTAAQRAAAPYSQVGLVVAAYADGTFAVATCALVGRNDILTATHVLYDPAGDRATGLAFYFGADYNAVNNAFDSGDFSYALTDFKWTALDYRAQVYADSDPSTLTEKEMAYDLALIGVSVPVGDAIGWLGMDPGWDFSSQATQVGYPTGTTGMQTGDIGYEVAKPYTGTNLQVYESFTFGNMGAGSSGGPLLQDGHVIGVKSAGSNLSGYWADIGNVYGQLVDYIGFDDYLLTQPGQAIAVTGTTAWDIINTSAGDDSVNGLQGTDWVLFSGNKGDYTITVSNGVVQVTDKVALRDGHDVLTNVERIAFADYGVAFDIDGAAGQAYRLYKAAFDRVPDLPGLGYQMNALDQGYSLAQVASAFIASPEFQSTYGNVDNTQFITLLYRNVLDRAPDAGGLQFHLDEIAHGESRADVLTHFSESPENKANVIGLIQGGMTYEF